VTIGTTWPLQVALAKGEGQKVEGILPTEGSTGWSDTWMVGADAQNPNCAYEWMDWIASPKVQAQVAEYFGEAPANPKACDYTSDPGFCTTYHADDKAYADKIWYWTTPITQCLDGRKDVQCTDYGDWTTAWTEVKG
jgi:putative spermidine/putrescine transport system substrate-binding protein